MKGAGSNLERWCHVQKSAFTCLKFSLTFRMWCPNSLFFVLVAMFGGFCFAFFYYYYFFIYLEKIDSSHTVHSLGIQVRRGWCDLVWEHRTKNFAQHVFAFAISLLDSLPYLFRKTPCLMHMQNETWPQGWLWIQADNSIVKYLSVKSPERSIAVVFWLEHAADDGWGDREENKSWILYKEEGGWCGLLAFSIALSCILTVWVVKDRLDKVAWYWAYSSAASSSQTQFRVPIQLAWAIWEAVWVPCLLLFQATSFTYYSFLTVNNGVLSEAA